MLWLVAVGIWLSWRTSMKGDDRPHDSKIEMPGTHGADSMGLRTGAPSMATTELASDHPLHPSSAEEQVIWWDSAKGSDTWHD